MGSKAGVPERVVAAMYYGRRGGMSRRKDVMKESVLGLSLWEEKREQRRVC